MREIILARRYMPYNPGSLTCVFGGLKLGDHELQEVVRIRSGDQAGVDEPVGSSGK